MQKKQKVLPLNKNPFLTSGAGISQRIAAITAGEEDDVIGIIPHISWDIDGNMVSEAVSIKTSNLTVEPYQQGLIIRGNKFKTDFKLCLSKKTSRDCSVKVKFERKFFGTPCSYMGVFIGNDIFGNGTESEDIHIYKQYDGRFYKHSKNELKLLDQNCRNDEFWIMLTAKDNEVCSFYSEDNENWLLLSKERSSMKKDTQIGITFYINEAEFYNWFLMNFIQFESQERYDYGDWSPIAFYLPMYYDKAPFFGIDKIIKKVIESVDVNIIDFIKTNIDEGRYCSIEIDEYYIKELHSYSKYHAVHHNMIYGYDDEAETLYLMSYNINGIVFITVSYNDFMLAYRDTDKNGTIFLTFIEQGSIKFNFDISVFIRQLEEYYYSNDLSERYKQLYNEVHDKSFGIKVYETILRDTINLKCFVRDYRMSHFIYEHKKVLCMSIEFLYARGYLKESDYITLSKEFNELESEALNLRNLVLKNSLNLSIDNLSNIVDKIDELKLMEQIKLPLLIRALNNTVNEER